MDDLISRQAAIDAVNSIDNLDAKARGGICFKLMGLPSAQPETIRPAWKADNRYVKTMFQPFPYCPKCNHYLIYGDSYCSVCGRRIDWRKDDE